MITRRAQKNLTWVALSSPTQDEVRSMMREFDVHPLIADELLSPSIRQKTERYGEFLYLVLHFPAFGERHEHVAQEIDFVVGKKVLITAEYDNIDALNSFGRSFESALSLDNSPLAAHGGHLLYHIIRKLYRSLTDEIEYLREEIRHIEERIFNGEEKSMVVSISRTSRVILDFRRSLAPHEEILASLDAAGGRLFGQEFSFYARLLQSEYLKVQNGLDELRDALQELRETNNSLLSTKQNEIMKTLTIMAFVTFPLTLIATIFSMRAKDIPIVGEPGDFWIILGIMAAMGLILFLYFKSRRWL
ncbi:MAG: magnesium transporter CorA family protein [Patescibacteria group bacterium]|nr:magnesium transporter CorA family protein [Patescibacteria group bacterium]